MDPFLMMAAVGAGSSILSGITGSSGAKKAAAQQAAAIEAGERQFQAHAERGEGFVNSGTDAGLGYVTPYASGGQDALKLYMDAIGANGRDAQASYHRDFMDDPGFQAALDQGQRQVEHSSIFQGRGDSGATMKELFQFGENARLGAFNSRLDRLSSLSQLGLDAGKTAGSMEVNRGTTLADIALKRGSSALNSSAAAGAARAGGTVASTNAITGALSGLGSSAIIGSGSLDGGKALNTLMGANNAKNAGKTITSLFS